jgi:hypothetical protein
MSGPVIADLRDEVNRLRAALRAAETALMEARVAASGVSVGQIVVRTRGGSGVSELGRVLEVIPKSYGKAWVDVNPRLKSGQFGNARRRWFENWELAPDDSQAPSR